MKRTLVKDLREHIGDVVMISGWVHVRRDHGKLIFIDLRESSGKVQMVALPAHEKAHVVSMSLRPEWVIEVSGEVKKRPEKMVNADEPNGDIEIEISEINVLNESETTPFEISEDSISVDEITRLKYRYLDLRTERMQKNMRVRSEFVRNCRDFLNQRDFTEIETPILTAATLEGSRDFIVPSRLNPGKFYALPQSPQQYKQLLMTAGFERYFQIARAVRDEDLRADRGFEHSQIDIEMSFVSGGDVLEMVEKMITVVVESMGYTIKETPFPRITYKEALEKHDSDKFDLRNETEKKAGVLAYAWVTDFPLFEKTDEGEWTFSHNPFSMPKDEYIEDLLTGKTIGSILSTQYDLVCNGYEVGGGSMRSHRADILKAVYKVMGYSKEETEASVGHMLRAFKYGTPPHGGIALGIERNIMILTGEKALREVQAFPMTRGGVTAVMDGPGDVSKEQLDELGIAIKKKKHD